MTIRFAEQEKCVMRAALADAGVPATPANIRKLAEWMCADYLEQVEYLASDLAVYIAQISLAERRGSHRTADRVRRRG
jgi:hypothetical protein